MYSKVFVLLVYACLARSRVLSDSIYVKTVDKMSMQNRSQRAVDIRRYQYNKCGGWDEKSNKNLPFQSWIKANTGKTGIQPRFVDGYQFI